MLGYKGPAKPSPSPGDVLNAGYEFLEVRCLVALYIVRRRCVFRLVGDQQDTQSALLRVNPDTNLPSRMEPSAKQMSLFESYPNDKNHIPTYIAYQSKYIGEARESDKVIIELLRGASGELLDIGCSTGNLLRHVQAALPALSLTGGEMSDAQLDACKADPSLSMNFEKLDILNLPANRFDYIVANAILYGFGDEDFDRALGSIAASLRLGGTLIAFDFFHGFPQELTIVERSSGFPDGHPLHFRSFERTKDRLKSAGFAKAEFHPFNIPKTLKPSADNPLQTYTVETVTGVNLQLRGALAQPWCHLVAKR
jgi:SAM-dependent methyltransferase